MKTWSEWLILRKNVKPSKVTFYEDDKSESSDDGSSVVSSAMSRMQFLRPQSTIIGNDPNLLVNQAFSDVRPISMVFDDTLRRGSVVANPLTRGPMMISENHPASRKSMAGSSSSGESSKKLMQKSPMPSDYKASMLTVDHRASMMPGAGSERRGSLHPVALSDSQLSFANLHEMNYRASVMLDGRSVRSSIDAVSNSSAGSIRGGSTSAVDDSDHHRQMNMLLL